MTFRERIQLIEQLCGLTLEEWENIKPEVEQHFRMKCMQIRLNEMDAHEIARLVSLRMDMEWSEDDDAPRQTKMSL